MEIFYMTNSEDYIKLGQALKAVGYVESGAEAKQAVQDGSVAVNGEVEVRRGRKLRNGDIVEYSGRKFKISTEKEQ